MVEIFNQIASLTEQDGVAIAIGVNRDLLFDNTKTIYREYKNNEFDYVFEVNRNEAGYNYRDVHGQLIVTQNRIIQDDDNPGALVLLENID